MTVTSPINDYKTPQIIKYVPISELLKDENEDIQLKMANLNIGIDVY